MTSAPEEHRRPAPSSRSTGGSPGLLAAAAIAALLTGCTPATTTTTTDASAAPSATSSPSAPPPSATHESASPAPGTLPVTVELVSGEVGLSVALPADGEAAVEPGDDGSARLVLDGSRRPAGVSPVATLDSPGELTGNTDGSLTVTGPDGVTATGGLSAPDGGRWRVVDATTAELVADDGAEGAVTTTLGTAGVASADWGDREGGRSLAVDPTSWARDAGAAGVDVVWSELIADDPSLESATMHDQLVCHSIGAPDKATWNLEPWRPDVGLLTVLAERCNPTEDS